MRRMNVRGGLDGMATPTGLEILILIIRSGHRLGIGCG